MTALVFLKEYSGETIEGLLALESTHRIDSIVMAIHQGIDQKAARVGTERLSSVELTILAVESLESEVNGGGFGQFFRSRPEYAAVIVDCLLEIGCPVNAAIASEAIRVLGAPTLDEAAIAGALQRIDARCDSAWDACDRRYFDHPEPIELCLFEYVRRNQDSVRLP